MKLSKKILNKVFKMRHKVEDKINILEIEKLKAALKKSRKKA